MTRVRRAEASWQFNSKFCDSNQGMGVPVASQGDASSYVGHSIQRNTDCSSPHGTFRLVAC